MVNPFRVISGHRANDRERLASTGNKDDYPHRTEITRTAYCYIEMVMRRAKPELDRKEPPKFGPVFCIYYPAIRYR
ncbi:hypothetical protein A6P37_30145 (plasmid) [Klebsiella pneumoniae]|nr:hypothetical protein A6P37_30145 [Klebsiella pneumoniae]